MIELLKGIRVLECAVLLNGDTTGRLLGDLGADVVKIEAPGVGDYLRDMFNVVGPNLGINHLQANRNKRSFTLNLRSDEGRKLFFDLLKTTDIFVDGFAGDACAKLGIGYAAQKAVKPDIIYCQCTGYGAHGPFANVPTHGQMMGALAGSMPLAMGDDGLVRATGGGIGDGSAVGASYAAMTALAALHHRARTGEGAYIDGSGADGVLMTSWSKAVTTWNSHRFTGRRSNYSLDAAKYQFYETSDNKFILFCGIEPKFWNNFCQVVGQEDWLDSGRSPEPVDFGEDQEALRRQLQKIFHTRTQREWWEIALKHDIAMGPAHRYEDLLADPQLRAREIVHEAEHPEAGRIIYVGWPAPVRGQPFEVGQPAPSLGQHTDELLESLGCDAARIAAYRNQGVV